MAGRNWQDARMAREIRLQCPGAIHHVMGRGDGRERVFLDDADYCLFAHKRISERIAMGFSDLLNRRLLAPSLAHCGRNLEELKQRLLNKK